MRVLFAATLLSLAWSAAAARWDLPPVWWFVAATLVLVAGAVDAWLARRRWGGDRAAAMLTVTRRMPHAFALGVTRDVVIRIANSGPRDVQLSVFDFVPAGLRATGLPQTTVVKMAQVIELTYQVTPIQRGPAAFSAIEARIDSPLELWQVRSALGAAETVRVYPNFAAVAKFALLATDHRLSRLGVRIRRRRGEGMEFHQLREYRQGDSLRQIDWKATTRQRKLISREYQDERDQRLVFMLDCSRRMRAQDGDLSHFDQALNSLMLLTHVAIKQGDSVGALTFGGVDRFLAPGKGPDTLNVLTNALYDIEPQPRTGDFLSAAERLMREVPKRSMVMLLTNLRDEDEAELGMAIRVLSTKHLVVVASLRESVLEELARTTVRGLDEAIALSATHLYLEERRKTFARLVNRQTFALDVEPKALPIALVNQYLEIKRSGRL
jgi:uncharacterized protein (DUF58 family)